MDAGAGTSPPQHQELPTENPPKQGGRGGGGGMAAPEMAGEAGNEFLFTDDTFPSLPDFPCLSSPSTSTFSSSSTSSNSTCAFPSAAGGGVAEAGEPAGPATAADGFDVLGDLDHLLDFASLSVPWDAEPLFPDVGMMIDDAISAVPQPPAMGDDGNNSRSMRSAAAGGGGGEGGEEEADLPRFFMEWLTSNKDNISAEDLRSIRLRRSTIEAAAARLGDGRQGTMQLLKLILTWVQNHHLHKKRPRAALEEAAHGHQGQLHGSNPTYELGACGQDSAATSWVPYPAFPPQLPAYGGDAMYQGGTAVARHYTFHQSCSTSSVVVSTQPFSPPADVHAMSGGSASWPVQQYAQIPAAAAAPYQMPQVVPQTFVGGFTGQFSSGHPLCPQRAVGMEPSATKEARKKRMARQRRLSCLHQQRSHQLSLSQGVSHPPESSPQTPHSIPGTLSQGGCRNWGFWPPATQQHSQQQANATAAEGVPPQNQAKSNSVKSKQLMPAATEAMSAPGDQLQQKQDESPQRSTASEKRQGAKADKNLRFLLQKVLKQSDVGSLGRIVLPKKEAEIHLPELETRDGISIPMEDIGTSRVWNMRYRFWPNNKSRMYLLENTGDFVRSNELQEGDFIVIYSDVKSGKYLIRGVKVRPSLQEQSNSTSTGSKPLHKHGSSDKAGASDAKAGAEGHSIDAGKVEVGGKGKKALHSVPRSRCQDVSVNQMTVSI